MSCRTLLSNWPLHDHMRSSNCFLTFTMIHSNIVHVFLAFSGKRSVMRSSVGRRRCRRRSGISANSGAAGASRPKTILTCCWVPSSAAAAVLTSASPRHGEGRHRHHLHFILERISEQVLGRLSTVLISKFGKKKLWKDGAELTELKKLFQNKTGSGAFQQETNYSAPNLRVQQLIFPINVVRLLATPLKPLYRLFSLLPCRQMSEHVWEHQQWWFAVWASWHPAAALHQPWGQVRPRC